MLEATWALGIFGAIIATLFSLLIGIVWWNWTRLHQKVDELLETIHTAANELHARITSHDRRITTLEVSAFGPHRRHDDEND